MIPEGNNVSLSVLISNYNHSHQIRKSLAAILSQSYQPKEIIIIDDASTDDSIDIISKFKMNFPIIRLIQNERNEGVVKNLITLTNISTGDYLYFASADDAILPGFFEYSMNLLTIYPNAGLSCTNSVIINDDDHCVSLASIPRYSNKKCFITAIQCKKLVFDYSLWFMSNTAIFKKESLSRIGGFSIELESYFDMFAIQLIAFTDGICYIPDILAAYRNTNTSYSINSFTNNIAVLDNYQRVLSKMKYEFPYAFSDKYQKVWGKRGWLNIYQMKLRYVKLEHKRNVKDTKLFIHKNISFFDKLLFFVLAANSEIFISFMIFCKYLINAPNLVVKVILIKFRNKLFFNNSVNKSDIDNYLKSLEKIFENLNK